MRPGFAVLRPASARHAAAWAGKPVVYKLSIEKVPY
jgi:hypothetical protein